MPRHAMITLANFDSIQFCGAEKSFAVRHRLSPSSFDFVIDDDPSVSLGLPPDATGHWRPQAAHYLFNSMPCAYAWFHH